MAVQQELAQMTGKAGEVSTLAGTARFPDPRQERLAKLEAVGRGDLHPRTADPSDPKNRRIEITVHFTESDKAAIVPR